jgi:hypothetical protein
MFFFLFTPTCSRVFTALDKFDYDQQYKLPPEIVGQSV